VVTRGGGGGAFAGNPGLGFYLGRGQRSVPDHNRNRGRGCDCVACFSLGSFDLFVGPLHGHLLCVLARELLFRCWRGRSTATTLTTRCSQQCLRTTTARSGIFASQCFAATTIGGGGGGGGTTLSTLPHTHAHDRSLHRSFPRTLTTLRASRRTK
jgi:hypothetical protein